MAHSIHLRLLLAIYSLRLVTPFQIRAKQSQHHASFISHTPIHTQIQQATPISPLFATATDDSPSKPKPIKRPWDVDACMYRRNDGNWKPRININDVTIGQRLLCSKLSKELRDGKTGAKIFFECGVGRIDPKTKRWMYVNGMVRITQKPKQKATMITKRIQRISTFSSKGKKDLDKPLLVPLFVSRVYPEKGMLELVPKREDIPPPPEKNAPKRISAGSLTAGMEVTGRVTKVVPFGAFIDVNANRGGLLHIQTIADTLGTYVDGVAGMKALCGLEVGAQVNVSVLSNERKRLAFDFTKDVKDAMEEEREEEARLDAEEEARLAFGVEDDAVDTNTGYEIGEDEAAAWAEFGAIGGDGDGSEDDEPDEMDDIEQTLGLNFY